MMRSLLVLLGALLVAAGCGQAGSEDPGAESSTVGIVESRPKQDPEPQALAERPPPIVLVSDAGRQEAVTGSFCVTGSGYGLCADAAYPPEAKQASVVRPGDTITIALDGARAVKADGCHARDRSCIGEAQVLPAGCKSAGVARIFLERGPETQWRVSLPPGAYELQVFVYFEADDGRSGDVSAALGLVVDPDAEPEIVPMPAAAAVCP